jgi:hypothetical protein
VIKFLAIPVLFLLPGLLFLRLCTRERSAGFFLLAFLVSFAFTSVAAFVLAVAGYFSIVSLVVCNVVVCILLLLVRPVSNLSFRSLFDNRFCFVALLILVGLFLYYSPPFEYYFGGRDPGVYTVSGIRIARAGTLTAEDPLLQKIPKIYRSLFFSQRLPFRYMGFQINDLATGRVVPNFFYLYPVWLAIFYSLFGVHGMLYATPFLTCAMLLAVSLFARILIGRTAALCSVLLLGSNAIYLWFARFPNSEMLAGLLIFAGLVFLHWYMQHSSTPLGLIGAASLGLAFWTRVDAGLLAIPFLFWMLFRWMDQTARKQDFWVLSIYIGVLLVGLLYGLHINRYYMLAAFTNLRFKPYKVVAAVGGALLLIGSLAYAGRRFEVHTRTWPGKILAGGLAILILYAYLVRPFFPRTNIGSPNAGALLALGWYFTHPVVALALIGFVLYSRKFTAVNWLFLTATLLYSCLYFYRIRGHAEHFWMLRRYLIFICPALIIFFLYTTEHLFHRFFRGSRRYTDLATLLITLVLALWFWEGNRPLHKHREFAGSFNFLQTLSNRLTPQDLLLLGSREGNDLHIIGPMLSYYFDKNVLVLRTPKPDLSLLAAFVKSWNGKVYYAGFGTGNLASDKFFLNPVEDIHFETPVFDEIYHRRPAAVFSKYFQIGWYRLQDRPAGDPYFVDLGKYDDGNISGFHLKESFSGITYRWTNGEGHVFFPPSNGSIISVVLQCNPGPWVPGMEKVHVKIYANDSFLVDLTLGNGYNTYEVPVPAPVQEKLKGVPLDIRIESKSWIPKRVLNLPDVRRVGVIVDWVKLNFAPSHMITETGAIPDKIKMQNEVSVR